MKLSLVRIIGGVLVVFGCCAIAIACLLASLVWGGCQGNGQCFATFPDLDKEARFAAAASAMIGLLGIAIGWRIRRMKSGSKRRLVEKVTPLQLGSLDVWGMVLYGDNAAAEQTIRLNVVPSSPGLRKFALDEGVQSMRLILGAKSGNKNTGWCLLQPTMLRNIRFAWKTLPRSPYQSSKMRTIR